MAETAFAAMEVETVLLNRFVLTSDALIAEKPKDAKGKAGAGHGGDYDMY